MSGHLAFDQNKAAAESGNAAAQCNLGFCYDTGQGVAENEVVALKWYRKAAEQNHAQAQYNLGVCYANGRGVEKDEVEALKWYRKAAEQNHAGAQDILKAYSNGQGVVKGEQNDAQAQYNRGVCYFNGQDVTKDYAEAAKWFRKAAEQNHPDAQDRLGVCYFNGECVPKHPDPVEVVDTILTRAASSLFGTRSNEDGAKAAAEAVKWFRKAAEQGNANAQNKLAVATRKAAV